MSETKGVGRLTLMSSESRSTRCPISTIALGRGIRRRCSITCFALLPERPRVLEVGPGTGQATQNLYRTRRATVHAIEIGPAMAAKLRQVLPATSTRQDDV